MFAGRDNPGFSVSLIVTVNVQLETPHEFVAVAVTVVVPTGKVLPETGEKEIVGAGVPVAVAVNVTLFRAQRPVVLARVMLAGHVMAGPRSIVSVAFVPAVSLAEVVALTWNEKDPLGVSAVVDRVSVPLAESAWLTTWIGFGVNTGVTPAGSPVAVMVAMKFPLLPDPVPRFTVTGKVTLPAVPAQRLPACASRTTDPTFGESVNVTSAWSPDVCPSAVASRELPRQSSPQTTQSEVKEPLSSATTLQDACATPESGVASLCRTWMATSSPGANPVPVRTAVSPG